MALETILGATLLSGGLGGLTGWLGADAEQKRIAEKNKQLEAAKRRVEEERNKLRQESSSLSREFITNYLTVRDPQRAEGIRQSYGQNVMATKQMERDLSNQITQLDLAKEQAGLTGLQGLGLGLGTGALQGGMSGIAMGMANDEGDNLFKWQYLFKDKK